MRHRHHATRNRGRFQEPRTMSRRSAGCLRLTVLVDGKAHLRSAYRALTASGEYGGLGLPAAWAPAVPSAGLSATVDSSLSSSPSPPLALQGDWSLRAISSSLLSSWAGEPYSAGIFLTLPGCSEPSDEQGGVVLELLELPWFTTLRRLLRAQPKARLLSLNLPTTSRRDSRSSSSTAVLSWSSAIHWLIKDSPCPAPGIYYDASSSDGNDYNCSVAFDDSKLTPENLHTGEILGLKEVVVGHSISCQAPLHTSLAGASRDLGFTMDPETATRCPNLFPITPQRKTAATRHGEGADSTTSPSSAKASSPTGVFLRSLPSPTSCLVLQVRSLAGIREKLRLSVECIGKTSASRGQLILELGHVLSGLDIRLCEDPKLQNVFHEGESVLMEDVIIPNKHEQISFMQREQTSARAGLDNTASESEEQQRRESDALVADGDCWMEMRAMAKRPSGFIR